MTATFRTSLLLAALGSTALLAACSGSSTPSSPIPSSVSSAPAAVPVSSTTDSVGYGAASIAGATYVGPAKLTRVGADVVMTMSNEAGLLAYAKAANDPKNALYRHWLTPQQLGDRFGAPAAVYSATAKYFISKGIGVSTYPQRQLMHINGPQAAVQQALGTQFGVYRLGSRTFVAPVGAAHPSTSLHIAALGGVIGYSKRTRRLVEVRASNAFVNGFSPQQLAQGFDYNGAYAAGYKGDGITIGIIGTGPITDGDSRIKYGDVAEYKTLFGLSGTGKVVQDIDLSNYAPEYSQSGLATPPPVTNPFSTACSNQGYDPSNPSTYSDITDYTTCNPEDEEAQLDTEQASGLAPDATVNFYIAYNPSECYGSCSGQTPQQEEGLNEADDEIQKAIADDASDVISMSFGEDEASSEESGLLNSDGTGLEPTEFASLASEGIAVFASSGDLGAEECQDNSSSTNEDEPCVTYPATDPNVLSIGGVNAPFNNAGTLTGPITGWGEATQIEGLSPGASGGGCSVYFSEPTYAANASLPCSGKRSQPDVALDADTNTGVADVIDADPSLGGRFIGAFGGTSVSSPEFAAMWALVLEACKNTSSCATASGSYPYRLGNPGTYLYPIYLNKTEYADTFYDVLFGNNSLPNSGGSGQDSGYTAGSGYDLVTGLGAPYALHLIQNVLAQK